VDREDLPQPGAYGVEETRVDGLDAVALSDSGADLRATWIPPAGMLGASLVHRGEELLWTGAGAGAYARDRAFAGIPFLHPWANRLERFGYTAGGRRVELDPASPLLLQDEHGLPIHGVLTASPWWRVERAGADAGGAHLEAALDFDRPELLAVFPFPHRVHMGVTVAGGAVTVRTTVIPTGEDAVPIAFGFHPYLRLPGLPRAAWELDLPVRRRLLHDARLIPTGAGEPTAPIAGSVGARTWDDGFDGFALPARFAVRGASRTLAVEHVEGYPVTQVFAPPGQEYVCLEPMTAPANALAAAPAGLSWVAPGGRHTAGFRIVVGPEE
jgi:aldose 1-epimerase